MASSVFQGDLNSNQLYWMRRMYYIARDMKIYDKMLAFGIGYQNNLKVQKQSKTKVQNIHGEGIAWS